MNNLDAVKMIREIRDEQHEELKNKNAEERRRYFDENSSWAFEGLQKKQSEQTQKIKK